MSNYIKNAVKILPKIDVFENNLVIYTEFNGNFEIGDKVYIMVVDEDSVAYEIDSLNYASTLTSTIGYELLNVDGNKLTLNIKYDTLPSNMVILEDECYVSRVYLKHSIIKRGTINGTNMYKGDLKPNSNINLIWKQGILYDVDTDYIITHIDFKSKLSDDDIILSSKINHSGTVSSYYTKNNNGLGISYIYLRPDNDGDDNNRLISIDSCNIYAGIFKNCYFIINNYDFFGKAYIYGGKQSNCLIGKNYVIDGGYLEESEISDITITWKSGTWDNSFTSYDSDGNIIEAVEDNNPFRSFIWESGTWENGEFPINSTWKTGRFKDGIFKGLVWSDGIFNNGIFESIWKDGIFYGGYFQNNSVWENGEFNEGEFIDSYWKTGTFNGGKMYSTIPEEDIETNGVEYMNKWDDGIFNDGSIENIYWGTGTFNNGLMTNCIWNDGIFNDGDIYDTTWNFGKFYSGKINTSIWNDGSFYKGSMFNSDWKDGDLFYGVLSNVIWTDGTWHNGIANNVKFINGVWKSGIFNYGEIIECIWEKGSFNSGYFGKEGETPDNNKPVWENGNFYFGEFFGIWENGTFYTGKDVSGDAIPEKDKLNKRYKQYNTYGLYKSRGVKKRLPKKRLF